MTKEEETLLRTFETRVRQLMLQYGELERKNRELASLLDEKDQALRDALADADRLRQDYANLKLARMMEIGDDDVKNAKSRLSRLVREVDKCIALLNV